MPLTKLTFKPGINKEGTTYSNEGGYYDCDKIRFRSGFPEKIGGWSQYASGFVGAAGTMWNWVTYDSANLLAIGTNQKYYIENSATFHDITPLRSTATGLSNIFTTASGSNQVTVNHTSHGATVGAYVTFSGASTFNGVTMNGEFQIVSVTNANTYIVLYTSNASGTGSGGGASITAEYQINPGNIIYTTGVGWGVPAWGFGGWGSATAAGIPPRIWSQDNFEQDLLFAYNNGPIYYWAANTTTYPRAVTLQDYANTVTKVQTTTTALSTTSSITVASTDGINTGSVISGSGIPAGTYVLSTWDFSTTIPLSAVVSVSSGATITASFAGRHAPNKTSFVIASDTSHFTIALGSKPYDPTNFDPTYDPMLVRWSDQDSPYEWVPEITNQSGEQHLSNGSYLVAAVNTRQEILLWSDTALYSMQYLGPPYVWGFNLIGDNTSIISPNAIISVNTVVYWMGVDKFYQYNGRLETLSCTIWKYVYDNLNKSQAHQVVCGSNEGFSEIWWFYPSKDSVVNDSYVIFNYLENTWYYGTMRRTAWLDSALRPSPMGVYSIQNSFLKDPIGSANLNIELVNAVTYPPSGVITIDSEQISYASISGNTLMSCVRGVNGTTAAAHGQYAAAPFSTPNQIVYHESGQDDGVTSPATAIYSYLDSSDFDIEEGHSFGFITRVVPDITFRGSSTDSPSVVLKFRARTNTTSDPTQTSGSGSAYQDVGTSPTNVTRTSTSVVEQYTSQVFTRVRGRQAAFRVESSGLGVAWQVGAMRIDVRKDGRR